MSSSFISEDLRYITTCDHFNDVQFSKIDTDILMSFLEESEIEESDEERIRQVIQSLEAEISPVLINESYSLKDCAFSDTSSEVESCSTSCDLEFECIDSKMTCSTPSDDKSIWSMDYSGDSTNDVIEFIDTIEFSQTYDGVSLMEEHDQHTFLWEETCESMLYEYIAF